MASQIREALDKVYEAWNTGNTDLLDEVYAPDVVYHMPPFPDMDLAGLKQFLNAFRMSQPDFKVWEDERTSEGDRTCVRYSDSGTFSAEGPLFPGVKATGLKQSTSGAAIIRWKNGKAVEVWHFGDWLGGLQQQGVLPPMG